MDKQKAQVERLRAKNRRLRLEISSLQRTIKRQKQELAKKDTEHIVELEKKDIEIRRLQKIKEERNGS